MCIEESSFEVNVAIHRDRLRVAAQPTLDFSVSLYTKKMSLFIVGLVFG